MAIRAKSIGHASEFKYLKHASSDHGKGMEMKWQFCNKINYFEDKIPENTFYHTIILKQTILQ
jgi:hypothetical protein